ncbi:MAG: carboxy terminal-processing peptidase [Cellvibrionaceae bacterium]
MTIKLLNKTHQTSRLNSLISLGLGLRGRIPTPAFHLFRLTSKNFVSITLSLFLLTSSAHSLTSNITLDTLKPTEGHSQTTKEVMQTLSNRHFKEMPIDDALSEKFLDNYIESLDPGKSFFFASDIKEFNKHKTKFDDDFRAGKLNESFKIYNRYRNRVELRLEAIIARLENEDQKFDFTVDEKLPLDLEDAEWAVDQSAATQMWHKRLKSNLLNLMLTDKTLEEARETLIKRYKMQLNRFSQQKSSDAYETIINALTTLYDPHTNYFGPRQAENFNINMSLKLEGIGAVLRTDEEYTKVDRIVTGGPADKQGELKRGDRIIAVGQADSELEDVIDWRLDDVVKLIRGERNTIVHLKLLTPENLTKSIKITRDTVKLEEQAAKKAVFDLSDGKNLYKVGVIDVPNFYIDFDAYRKRDPNYRSTTRDVFKLLKELEEENVDGVILDLRDNGGGSLQEATQLTDLFIDPGPVVQIRQSNEKISRHSQSRNLAQYRGPLIVLINRLSASASEIFAGAIQDYQRGLIVGNQSFGKGTVQSLSPLTQGQLKITESKFYRVSGDSTQHRGVVPDISYHNFIALDEIGESSYDNALPWDQIHEVPHSKYYDLEKMFPYLQTLHEKRAEKDPDFVFLIDQSDLFNENLNQKTISLNEKTRKSEQEAIKLKSLAIENKRRLAKGLSVYKTVDEFQTAEEKENEEDEEQSISGPQEINPAKDPVLNETGYVLIDYIKLLEGDRVQKVANF